MPHFIDLSFSFFKEGKLAILTINLKWFDQQPKCILKLFSYLDTVKYLDLTEKN